MAMTVEEFKQKQNVFKFGDTGNKFYIILDGKVAVLIPDKVRVTPEVTEKRKEEVFYLKGVINRI